jgi:hypothetical protein
MSHDDPPQMRPSPQPAVHRRAKIAAMQHFVVTAEPISPSTVPAPLTYINAQRAAARFPLQTLNLLRASVLAQIDDARAKAKTLSANQTILYDTTESDLLFACLHSLVNQAQDALRKHVDENLNLDDSHEHDTYPEHSHPHEDFEDE